MVRITVELLRKRAEHNDGLLATLEEITLHQQNIERIELLGYACRNLKMLYLQNNLIAKIENLHRLKELQYLNLAINNITKVQNLQRCESLARLDLTMNFVTKACLPTVASLAANEFLTELHLVGNPCSEWANYRPFVIASVPQLLKLDGVEILEAERSQALQQLPSLQESLRIELLAEGVDPESAAQMMRRPWCPATRVLEHREMKQLNADAEEQRRASQAKFFGDHSPSKPYRHDFPPLQACTEPLNTPHEGSSILQKNEGQWEFALEESRDGLSIHLDVEVGRFLDSSLIKADVQPRHVRLLIKGHLLQLALPVEIKPGASAAQRSATTGNLLLIMPKEDPAAKAIDQSCWRCVHMLPRHITAIDHHMLASCVKSNTGVGATCWYCWHVHMSWSNGKYLVVKRGLSEALACNGSLVKYPPC
ncbi:outer arm dynein light chain 1 [Coccomyxa subellipsoidea C-169]|uniref:Outer arm dynein light chain 1 n=1 Tax=Coccomyxa subellipsoidea (strain C-169) TaxID=574566 RepID=I0Z008_COCSC|nr:outer arm dynein light chain 1 [Coccomyxa subellipsoidea C-169]EIE23977.1 outer arm dynein light chain 1 [Coccomyxa subellipsoidea C-169]|eukprot:XP_005648521.1 outer arm dynein light chain 1 [Coccomyxa subellipsoidea C-169]